MVFVGITGFPQPQSVSARSATAAARRLYRPTHQWLIADFNRDGFIDGIVPSGNAIFDEIGLSYGPLGASRVVLGAPARLRAGISRILSCGRIRLEAR